MTEAALIQGIELHARTLVPYKDGSDLNTFLVGTQSLRSKNQIHRLTYNDETPNALDKKSYAHPLGEVWHLATNPNHSIIASCFNKITGDSSIRGGALFKINEDTLDLKYEIQPPTEFGREVRKVQFEPTGKTFAALVDSYTMMFDVESQKILGETQTAPKRTEKTYAFGFNANGDLLALNTDTTLRGIDVRSMTECWSVPNAHVYQIRSLDFNPNRLDILATAGDDCAVKFWDIRNLDKPLLTQRNHSHWVWSVRYNPYYDELVLTGSSDSKVHLLRVASISSEENKQEDVLLEVYDDHEDSIYCTEWAVNDPWVFASISYDGRLVINRVPSEEKFRILC